MDDSLDFQVDAAAGGSCDEVRLGSASSVLAGGRAQTAWREVDWLNLGIRLEEQIGTGTSAHTPSLGPRSSGVCVIPSATAGNCTAGTEGLVVGKSENIEPG